MQTRPLEAGELARPIDPSTSAVLRRAAMSATAGGSGHVRIPAGRASGEPNVELIRRQNEVVAIDVTCACGQKHRLLCDYEDST